jgi:hypothetical protein
VAGVVNWDVSSADRNARSVGSASFVIKVALNGSDIGGSIVSENGSVLFAHNDTLAGGASPTAASPPPSSTPQTAAASQATTSQADVSHAFVQGRQDRIDYEQWYAKLVDGPYKEGVDFWAANRSEKIPPSCHKSADTTWQQGCLIAQSMLARSDARRKSERDYKAGWNSL